VETIPRFGDSFLTTWAEDDSVYSTFGDGTALRDCYPIWGAPPDPLPCNVLPTCDVPEACILEWLFCEAFVQECTPDRCFEPCRITDLGLLRFGGSPPGFAPCNPEERCIVARNIPSGVEFFDDEGSAPVDRNDKPSSLLYLDGRLVLAGHSPALYAEQGWLAWSDDGGESWTEVPDAPWTGASPFRVLMFFNMGRAYDLNEDDFVYGLGIGWEAGWTTEPIHHGGQPGAEPMTVYLARVPRADILDYDSWRYYTGTDAGDEPTWSSRQEDAAPLPNLRTMETGSPVYHPGSDRYLFLTAAPGALWEAPRPWGPWRKVGDLFHESSEGTWAEEGYLPSIVPKDMGPDRFWFAISGNMAGYYLRVHELNLHLAPEY